jgi:hypothetical protein
MTTNSTILLMLITPQHSTYTINLLKIIYDNQKVKFNHFVILQDTSNFKTRKSTKHATHT